MKKDAAIKVLLIEDNPGDARLLREMLDEVQYQSFLLFHAETLYEGFNKLSEVPFDVVLLDIGLPDSPGIEAIKPIKQRAPELPIIMLTGLDDEDAALASLKTGAQDYLVKGQTDSGLLLRSIRYAIERGRIASDLESKQRFIQHIADATPDILYIFDITTHQLQYVNRALTNLLGYSREEINRFGESLYEKLLHPDDIAKCLDYIRRLSAGGDNITLNMECRIKQREGQWRWMDFSSVVFSRRINGTAKEVLGTAHDITARKEIEEQIRSSLEEKELLLREIHHRVKNNMAVISSLLKLQSRHTSSKQDAELFNDSVFRIKTMSLIHEKLYKSKNLAQINLGDYLTELTRNMFMAYGISSGRISLKTNMETVFIGIDSAIPCGLIANELLTNIMKHAFPDEMTGEIRISLREIISDAPAQNPGVNPETEVELIIGDNGTGIPEAINIADSKSLGMVLIHSLTKQLAGTLKRTRGEGTEFMIRFKK